MPFEKSKVARRRLQKFLTKTRMKQVLPRHRIFFLQKDNRSRLILNMPLRAYIVCCSHRVAKILGSNIEKAKLYGSWKIWNHFFHTRFTCFHTRNAWFFFFFTYSGCDFTYGFFLRKEYGFTHAYEKQNHGKFTFFHV